MNAIVAPKKIETVFDYDLTDEEHQLLAFGFDKEKYLSISSYQGITIALASLFGMRGDKKKQQHYLQKLDPDFVKAELKWDSLIQSEKN